MLRSKLALAAVALAAGAAGCTQCDTCDDFPTPCIGSNCGFQDGPPMNGPYMANVKAPDPSTLPPGVSMPPGMVVSAPSGPVSTTVSAAPIPPGEITPPPPTSVGGVFSPKR
jgi:hypothetical protein